jgi:DNA-binding transcriptional ArsR family regulator
MFKAIFGSDKRGRILLFILTHGESYAAEISRIFNYHLFSVQNQLLRLEKDGILYSKRRGNVRLFGLNPKYPFKTELVSLLEKALLFLSPREIDLFYKPRLRPRLTGKPF